MLISCRQSLYALPTLKTHDLPDPIVQTIVTSKVLSKISYCSAAWRGFEIENDFERIDAFLRRSKKFNFCCNDKDAAKEMFDRIDDKLFQAVSSDHHHILHPLL